MEKADEEPIVTALDQMIEAEDLILDDEAIYLPPFYYSEVGVANKIKRLLEESSGNLFDGTHDIEEIVKQTSIQYDDIGIPSCLIFNAVTLYSPSTEQFFYINW